MGFDDAGTFEVTTPGQPVSPHTVISSTNFNALVQDLAGGLSTAICRDGQSTVSANIPMNSKKFTGLAVGTARTDSASLANIQDGTGVYVATVGGSADAITLTPSPAITAYAAGQTFRFIASGANTTAVTVAVSGLAGPKDVTKNGSTALVAGDIPSGTMVEITYDGTRFILGTIGRAYLPITGGTLTGALTMGANLLFTDDTYNIGALGATRPKHAYLSGNLVLGGNLSSRATVGGHLHGLTISNSGVDATNDIVVAAGSTCSDNSPTSRNHYFLASALTKQLDAAWAVGTNAGMLDTGSIANTTYHIFLIMRSDTGVVDVLASTSATSPTMPTNYTDKRRIWSIVRAGATILPFTQDGDYCQLSTPVLDHNSTNPGTSAVTVTLATAPVGVNVRANLIISLVPHATNDTVLYLSDLATVDLAASATAAPLGQLFNVNASGRAHGTAVIRTNTSAQIRARVNQSDGSTVVKIATLGWFDRRGQDA